MLTFDVDEGNTKRIIACSVGDVDAGTLRQWNIVETQLHSPQRLGVGDGLQRPIRKYREVRGCVFEHTRIGVDPDAKHPILAEGHDCLTWTCYRNDHVVAPAPRPGCGILLDAAEQDELFADETR